MSQQFINTGSETNNKTGDPIQNAFKKANSNFTELYSTTNIIPKNSVIINTTVLFNFPPGEAYGYQAFPVHTAIDQSPATGKWDTNYVFYTPRNGIINKIIVTCSGNTSFDFAYIKNPTLENLVDSSFFDETFTLETDGGPGTTHVLDVNLPFTTMDYYGFAAKTNSTTVKLSNTSLYAYMEFT